MKLLGLDYGSKTVGVAVSDDLGLMAHGVETIFRDKESKLRSTLRRIEELCLQYNVDLIVLGNPINFDGTISERSIKTSEFKTLLESRINIPITLWDERCTTIEADEILDKLRVDKKDRKKYIDKISATIILDDYINNLNND